MHHGGEGALHVGDAAAEDLVAVDLGAKGFVLPGDAGRDADGVGVGIEQDCLAVVGAFDDADDAAVAVDPDAVEGQAAHFAFDALGDGLFLPAKTGDADDILRELDKLG